MAYTILNKKLQAVEDDLYMQMLLKKKLNFAFEVTVRPDSKKALASMQAGDVTDVMITVLNRADKRR